MRTLIEYAGQQRDVAFINKSDIGKSVFQNDFPLKRMTREEAINAGMEVHEIKHSMKRRTPWHDYSRKGTYMLTLVVRDRMALSGELKYGKEGHNQGTMPTLKYDG